MKLSKIATITLSACMVLASTSLYARGGNGGGNGNGGGKSGSMSGNRGGGSGLSGNRGNGNMLGNKGNGNRMSSGKRNYKNSPTSFTTYDADKDGKITQTEFDKVKADKMAQKANDGKLLKNASKSPQFSDIDTDKDGTITQGELSTFQQNRRSN